MTRLEVVSDVACPWCFIGARRLGRALAEEPPGSVDVAWLPFELQPGLPPAGAPDPQAFYAQKFGGADAMRRAFAQVAAVGEEVGIAFAFDRLRAPNTRLAHRLIWLAARDGRATQAADALFSGHFEQGADVADLDEALGLLHDAGVAPDRAEVEAGAGAQEVERAEREVLELGVQGVPLFVADRRYALSGAQPEEHLRELLAAARAARAA